MSQGKGVGGSMREGDGDRWLSVAKYDPAHSNTQMCESCSAGRWSSSMTGVCSQACSRGKYYKYQREEIKCIECSAVKFWSNSSTWSPLSCRNCPPSKFSANKRALSCKSCPHGKKTAPGARSCFEYCPAGKWIHVQKHHVASFIAGKKACVLVSQAHCSRASFTGRKKHSVCL